jgi:hypothetical protein
LALQLFYFVVVFLYDMKLTCLWHVLLFVCGWCRLIRFQEWSWERRELETTTMELQSGASDIYSGGQ